MKGLRHEKRHPEVWFGFVLLVVVVSFIDVRPCFKEKTDRSLAISSLPFALGGSVFTYSSGLCNSFYRLQREALGGFLVLSSPGTRLLDSSGYIS